MAAKSPGAAKKGGGVPLPPGAAPAAPRRADPVAEAAAESRGASRYSLVSPLSTLTLQPTVAALLELADANGLPRGATHHPDVESVEMFMFNYPQARRSPPAVVFTRF